LEICTIYETNLFGDKYCGLLLVYRLISFIIISWLVYEDVKIKHGLHYEKYTVWGEVSTLAVLFLLTLCSFEKYTKLQYKEGGKKVSLDNSFLHRITAFLFQWAILCESTLTFLFWAYLWGIMTDTAHMTSKQIKEKLYYDIYLDVSNYNHIIPLALLLVESLINNIPFWWRHYVLVFGINLIYLLFQYTYCQYTKKVVYPTIDWNHDAYHSLLKTLSTSIVTFAFFLLMRLIT